ALSGSLAFAVLALACAPLRDWFRTRDRVRAAAAWSIGLLGASTLFDWVSVQLGGHVAILASLSAVTFMVDALALLYLRHWFLPTVTGGPGLSRRTIRTATIAIS